MRKNVFVLEQDTPEFKRYYDRVRSLVQDSNFFSLPFYIEFKRNRQKETFYPTYQFGMYPKIPIQMVFYPALFLCLVGAVWSMWSGQLKTLSFVVAGIILVVGGIWYHPLTYKILMKNGTNRGL
jgi:hypothetical protein